jgi:pimeloyl-ACP methyl ester carboxylesterase
LNGAGTNAYLQAIERGENMPLAEVDGVRNGGRIDAPILLVHDRNDRVVPIEHGHRLAQAMPQSRLIQTEGLGHRRILSDAAIVQLLVAFARA